MSNIISIDLDENYFNAKMKLCRPNRQPIDNMVDVFGRKLHVRLGNIHDLSFSVPYYVTRNHKKVKNPLLDKIKLGFLVQLDFKGETQYFVFMDDSKGMDSDGETVSYNLKSLAYRLSKFDVREFEVEAYSLSQIMLGTTDVYGILAETNWTLGHVDVDFDLLYRSIQIPTSTVLQAIFDVAEKFGAIPNFDTVNRRIDFIKMESTGSDKGFKLTEGKYIESYGIDTTLDEIVTRLKCYGAEGLEFRNLSSIGANYLQDFSYFTYGFECDSNYNVISSSHYGMSDSLCVALKRFDDLVAQKSTEFTSLINQKSTKENEFIQLEQELSVLTTEKKALEQQLDLINITYGGNAPTRSDWQAKNTEINNKLLSIDAKNAQITAKENEITSVENSIIALGQLLATENNFTAAQIDELKDYIYVKEFSDTSIVEEEDLLKAGIEQFRKYREPKVTLKFDLVDFTHDFEYQADKKKINLGDISTFFSKRLNVEIQSRITEIEYDLDELNITLTISNDINKTSDEDILADLLKNVSSTSLTLDMNMYKLDLAKNADTMVTHMLNAAYDTGKNILLGGLENTNEMTDRGFYSRDYYNPTNNFLVINGGGLYITKDAARSVEVAINKDGVHSQRLVGNIILSNKVMVESTSGIVTIEDNAVTIKDASLTDRVILGRYPNPTNTSQYKHGLYVSDGAIDIRTSSVNNRGIQLDSEGIRSFNSNGVRTFDINATTGKVSIVGDLEIKTSGSDYRGIAINGSGLKGFNTSGTETVSIDAQTGKLTATGLFEVKTSNSGGRIVFSNEGIKAYNSQGIVTFDLDTAGGFTSKAYTERIESIDGNINTITNNVSALSLTTSGLQSTVGSFTTTIDNLGNRITGAESSITQQAGQIASKVSQTLWNGDTVSTLINQTATSVSIQASRINLTGAVMVNGSLTSTTINGGTITGTTINGTTINGGTITGTTITGGTLSSDTNINVDTNLYVGNRIYLKGVMGSTDSKGLYFGTQSHDPSITYNISGLQMNGSVTFFEDATYLDPVYYYDSVNFRGNVDFTNANVTGLTGGVGNYATQTWVTSQLSSYATQSYVSSYVTTALSSYATQSYVQQYVANNSGSGGGVTATYVQNYVTNALTGYATQSYVNNAVANTVGSATSGMYLAYSSGANRLYVRIGGSGSANNVGSIALT